MRQEVDSRDEVIHSEMSDSGLNRHQAVQIKKEKKSQRNIKLNFRFAFFRSRSKERKFQGAKVPHLDLSLLGANGLGSEKSSYRLGLGLGSVLGFRLQGSSSESII